MMRKLGAAEVMMRGQVDKQEPMWVHFSVEGRIPADEPLRKIKTLVDGRLAAMSPLFQQAYGTMGRPSIPPEQILKALLLRVLHSIRSERALVHQLNWNLLFRWFVDLAPDAPAWDATTFTKNRERFEAHGLVQAFFDGVVKEAVAHGLASTDHFTVDGTLIQAYASLKSFKPKDGSGGGPTDDDPKNPTVNFRGEKRSNATHASTTDPEARLARKGDGKEAKLCHGASILMENRTGLCVAVAIHEPAEEARAAGPLVSQARQRMGFTGRVTVGADKGYTGGPALQALERAKAVPHVPMDARPADPNRPGAKARNRAYRRQGTMGHAISQWIRKRVEEAFGWGKTIGGMERTRYKGRWRVGLQVLVTMTAYNLIRMTKCEA